MNEMINEILKAMKESNYRYFGIRGDNTEFEIGTELESSCDWDYENDCQSEEKLAGTCATKIEGLWFDGEEDDIETITKAFAYHGKTYQYTHTTIIAGDDMEYGADENETLIKNAEVIYKVK